MSSSVRLLLRPQQALKQVRWKSTTAVPPTGTFRPLHPLRGGAGIQHTPPTGKRSLSAFGNKFADYAQRGIVTCLFGLTIWGMYAMYDVHQHIMAKAQGAIVRALEKTWQNLTAMLFQEYEKRQLEGPVEEEVSSQKPEWVLAEAVQRSTEACECKTVPFYSI